MEQYYTVPILFLHASTYGSTYPSIHISHSMSYGTVLYCSHMLLHMVPHIHLIHTSPSILYGIVLYFSHTVPTVSTHGSTHVSNTYFTFNLIWNSTILFPYCSYMILHMVPHMHLIHASPSILCGIVLYCSHTISTCFYTWFHTCMHTHFPFNFVWNCSILFLHCSCMILHIDPHTHPLLALKSMELYPTSSCKYCFTYF